MTIFSTKKIAPCLWFDNRIEEAVNFYVSLFGGKILDSSRYGEGGPMPKGTAMTMTFMLHDEQFMALNGGPHFKFNEAVSFQVHCETQQEIDHFWSELAKDGEEGPCGWLKDKFGLSWQVIPKALPEMLMDGNSETAQRVMRSMLQMHKIDIAALRRAQAA